MNIDSKRCILFDLDGTVYLGDKPITGTLHYIQQNPYKQDIYFLTNNTSKNLEEYIHKLQAMGIETDLEHMISPLLPLAEYLLAENIHTIYPVGNSSFLRYLSKNLPHLTMSDGADCQAVVLAYDTELTYAKLAASCLLLQRPEVRFLATHPDAVCPSPLGPLPDTGSFIELYKAATGRRPELVFGKPNPLIVSSLLKKYNPEEMVMVGDRLYTDKVLAENVGMDFILVLSGESKASDLPGLERQPTMVMQDLGDFLRK